jgi:hypothetical protein
MVVVERSEGHYLTRSGGISHGDGEAHLALQGRDVAEVNT